MKTTYRTRWGCDEISVTADWARAECPVEGDAHGRQVADFRHSGMRALRAAVEDCALADGPLDQEKIAEIDVAMVMATTRK